VPEVDPDLRSALRRVQRMPGPPLEWAWARRILRLALAAAPTGMDGTGVTVEQPQGPVPGVRVFAPSGPRGDGALLWVHGGGYVLGAARMDDRLCATAARALRMVVVSAEYRLAPEHPFPAGLDDCAAAWQWVQDSAATLGVDPRRVAVGGQSAGGGLAAALCQRLHDEGGSVPAAQWLFCPMLDDRTAARRELDPVGHAVWDNRRNRYGWTSYLGQEPGAATVPPHAVPARRDDLSGLPPAWIGVGDVDLFHDESVGYAARLRAAGVGVELVVVPGAPHGIVSWAADTRPARDLVERAHAWLAAALSAPSYPP
jgi:acetyl esterase/lipase